MRLAACALAALCLSADGVGAEELKLGDGRTITYRYVAAERDSAQRVAREILRHLAAGQIDEAAQLSNEPRRRAEVLKDYRARVGEDEFKRVFARYLERPVLAEVALGPRRLLIWQLDAAAPLLAGQYYVESDGHFLMDDRPSDERSALRQVLDEQRRRSRRQ